MKKYSIILALAIIVTAWSIHNFTASAQKAIQVDPQARFVSANLVISQLYGSGGAAGAQYNHDFVEFFNRGSAPASLNGWSFQYASASGTDWVVTNLPNA